MEYRSTQLMMRLINSGFRRYLEWSPTILLCIVGLLTFCGIRYWKLPFYIYAMFPCCGIRCLFETMNPLAIAGHINDDSLKFVHELKSFYEKTGRKGTDAGHMRTVVKSFQQITCSAGSYFTFQKSIVLVCTTNTIVWTLNILILFK
jgi:hypothetical protein